MVQPIASGSSYPVISVNDQPATDLADFVGAADLMLDSHGVLLPASGTGTLSTESVRFHEKDPGKGDRDIRIWLIRQTGDTFTAAHTAT